MQPLECIHKNCTWMNYLPNNLWKAKHKQRTFGIDDDYNIILLDNEPELECRPKIFGYTDEEAEKVFPYHGYPKCSTKFPEYSPSMKLDIDSNILTMNCSQNFKGKFVLGVSQRNESFILDNAYNPKITKYKEPYSLQNDEEWALGTCDSNNQNMFEQVQYIHRPKPEVQERVKEKMIEQLKAIDKYKRRKPKEVKKLIIMLLTVDSASRRQTYRKLPKTIDFMKNLNSNYSVFDFKIHNVIGDNSARNQVPIFTGSQYMKFKGDKDNPGSVDGFFHGDTLKGTSIFNYMSRMGFATLMGYEFCHQYFVNYLGDKPEVDHLLGNFWCGAKKYSGYSFEKTVLGQRCIGPKMSHEYMLDYLLQFSNNYADLNQFIYSHITTGHEATGTQIETLDDDLTIFLDKYFQFAEKNNFELAVFLHGDHGMRYGEWYSNIAAYQEHRLPALFLISSNSLLDRMEYSYDTLQHNTNRLTSKLDIHLTLKTLAYMPYKLESSYKSFEYKRSKNRLSLKKAVNLFLEKVPNSRTCEDVFIPSFWCSCMSMNALNNVVYDQSSTDYLQIDEFIPTTYLIHSLLANVIEQINSETYSNNRSIKNMICSKVSPKEILSVYNQKILGKNDLSYKIEFSINEHKTARFEVYLVIGLNRKIISIREDAIDQYAPFPVYFEGKKLKARIMFIKRMDKYGGLCEEIAVANALDPQMCICNSFEHIEKYQPGLIKSFHEKFEVVMSISPGNSCQTVCENVGRHCNYLYFELINQCKTLKKIAKETWKELEEITCTKGTEISIVKQYNDAIIYTAELASFEELCEYEPAEDSYLACVCE